MASQQTPAHNDSFNISLEQIILTALMVPQVDPFDVLYGPNNPTTRWGLPLNLFGLSGIGKSQRVGAAVHMTGLPFQKVLPSHKQPEDFGNVPMQGADGELILACILPQARALMNAGCGVLYIDELTTARPAVQATCLGVVDERRVGDFQLPNTVRVITSMNPPEYAAGGFSLEAPLANRLSHVHAPPPSAREWGDWLLGRNQTQLPNYQNAEAMIKANWHNHWPTARALVARFIEVSGDSMLHAQPKPDDPAASGAWPSPRMWFLGACSIATVRCLNMPSALENILLYGCVGDTMDAEWTDWCQKATLPTPYDMLTKGWIADPQRLDVTITALNAMTSWLLGNPDKQLVVTLAENAWNIINDCFNAGLKDLAKPAASELCSAQVRIGVALNHECQNFSTRAAAIRAMKNIGDWSSMPTLTR